MSPFTSLIPVVYLLVAIPFAVMGLYAWMQRPAVGVTAFAWMMVSMAFWSFLYSLEISFPSLSAKIVLADFEYLGIVSIPVFLLIFALEYTGKRHLLTPGKRALLWFIPLIILIATGTNELHGWMWNSAHIEVSLGLRLLAVQRGPFFWLHIIYSYLLLFIATLILIMEFIRRPGVYRFQISMVLLGLLSPWFGSIFYVFDLSPISNLDLTPLFFLPSSMALGWAITRFRLLDVIPLEHVAVLRNMRDGVMVLDPQQRILYLNPIAELLFHRSESEAIGQPLDHISPKYAEALASHLAGTEEQFEASLGEDANAPVYEVTISRMSLMAARGSARITNLVVIFRDISLRKETDTLLSRRQAIMEAVSFAAEQFLKEHIWEPNVPKVLEKIGQAVAVSRVFVFMNYTDANGAVHSSQCYEWAAPGVASQINNPALQHIPLQSAGFGRWLQTLGHGEPLFGAVSDFPETERQLLLDQDIRSLAIVPIFVEKLWWGFIGFSDCSQERKWNGMELEALHAAASIFASAETRARIEQNLLRRQRALKLLQELVRASLRSTDISMMAETLVEELGKIIHADGCFLALWDPMRKQAVPLAAYGPYKKSYPALDVQPNEKTFTTSAIELGQTLVVEDARNSPYVSSRIANMFTSRSVLVLPLIAGENRLGAIMLTFDQSHRFLPDEIEINQQASSLIALALEKFQAVEHARRRAEEADRLRKAWVAVSESLHSNEAIPRILQQLSEVIRYDTASVQLLEGSELVIVGGRGWDNEKEVVGMRFPIPGDNPNTVVVETGEPLVLAEAASRFPAFRNPPHNHIRSWLGVPLTTHNRIIGLLAVDHAQPNYFSKDHVSLVTSFADQVAIALENARLYRERQTEAITDTLTNLYNRRGLFELGKAEFARSAHSGRPFSAIMIDLDHFKDVNDKYGHFIGDEVLRELALRCKRSIREMDFVGRYGGEEIVILLPETSMDISVHVAERLRNLIAGSPIYVDGDLKLTVTASLGVAHKDENTPTLETLIARADQAMYVSKHKGRNRVSTSR